jgi:hypothetical protein
LASQLTVVNQGPYEIVPGLVARSPPQKRYAYNFTKFVWPTIVLSVLFNTVIKYIPGNNPLTSLCQEDWFTFAVFTTLPILFVTRML